MDCSHTHSCTEGQGSLAEAKEAVEKIRESTERSGSGWLWGGSRDSGADSLAHWSARQTLNAEASNADLLRMIQDLQDHPSDLRSEPGEENSGNCDAGSGGLLSGLGSVLPTASDAVSGIASRVWGATTSIGRSQQVEPAPEVSVARGDQGSRDSVRSIRGRVGLREAVASADAEDENLRLRHAQRVLEKRCGVLEKQVATVSAEARRAAAEAAEKLHAAHARNAELKAALTSREGFAQLCRDGARGAEEQQEARAAEERAGFAARVAQDAKEAEGEARTEAARAREEAARWRERAQEAGARAEQLAYDLQRLQSDVTLRMEAARVEVEGATEKARRQGAEAKSARALLGAAEEAAQAKAAEWERARAKLEVEAREAGGAIGEIEALFRANGVTHGVRGGAATDGVAEGMLAARNTVKLARGAVEELVRQRSVARAAGEAVKHAEERASAQDEAQAEALEQVRAGARSEVDAARARTRAAEERVAEGEARRAREAEEERLRAARLVEEVESLRAAAGSGREAQREVSSLGEALARESGEARAAREALSKERERRERADAECGDLHSRLLVMQSAVMRAERERDAAASAAERAAAQAAGAQEEAESRAAVQTARSTALIDEVATARARAAAAELGEEEARCEARTRAERLEVEVREARAAGARSALEAEQGAALVLALRGELKEAWRRWREREEQTGVHLAMLTKAVQEAQRAVAGAESETERARKARSEDATRLGGEMSAAEMRAADAEARAGRAESAARQQLELERARCAAVDERVRFAEDKAGAAERRVEVLERELTAERKRVSAAQALAESAESGGDSKGEAAGLRERLARAEKTAAALQEEARAARSAAAEAEEEAARARLLAIDAEARRGLGGAGAAEELREAQRKLREEREAREEQGERLTRETQRLAAELRIARDEASWAQEEVERGRGKAQRAEEDAEAQLASARQAAEQLASRLSTRLEAAAADREALERELRELRASAVAMEVALGKVRAEAREALRAWGAGGASPAEAMLASGAEVRTDEEGLSTQLTGLVTRVIAAASAELRAAKACAERAQREGSGAAAAGVDGRTDAALEARAEAAGQEAARLRNLVQAAESGLVEAREAQMQAEARAERVEARAREQEAQAEGVEGRLREALGGLEVASREAVRLEEALQEGARAVASHCGEKAVAQGAAAAAARQRAAALEALEEERARVAAIGRERVAMLDQLHEANRALAQRRLTVEEEDKLRTEAAAAKLAAEEGSQRARAAAEEARVATARAQDRVAAMVQELDEARAQRQMEGEAAMEAMQDAEAQLAALAEERNALRARVQRLEAALDHLSPPGQLPAYRTELHAPTLVVGGAAGRDSSEGGATFGWALHAPDAELAATEDAAMRVEEEARHSLAEARRRFEALLEARATSCAEAQEDQDGAAAVGDQEGEEQEGSQRGAAAQACTRPSAALSEDDPQQQDRARIDAVGGDVCGAGGVCDGEEAESEAILSSPPAEELGEPRLTQGAQSGALYGRASEGTPRGLADVAAEQKKQVEARLAALPEDQAQSLDAMLEADPAAPPPLPAAHVLSALALILAPGHAPADADAAEGQEDASAAVDGEAPAMEWPAVRTALLALLWESAPSAPVAHSQGGLSHTLVAALQEFPLDSNTRDDRLRSGLRGAARRMALVESGEAWAVAPALGLLHAWLVLVLDVRLE